MFFNWLGILNPREFCDMEIQETFYYKIKQQKKQPIDKPTLQLNKN